MEKQIIVTVDATGQVSVEAVGFKGNACEKATAALEKALGTPKSGGKTKKPEYYQGNSQQAKQGL